MYQNLWNIGKEVLRGNFIAVCAHIKKERKISKNNIVLCLKELEK
jgi:hypothetical protein